MSDIFSQHIFQGGLSGPNEVMRDSKEDTWVAWHDMACVDVRYVYVREDWIFLAFWKAGPCVMLTLVRLCAVHTVTSLCEIQAQTSLMKDGEHVVTCDMEHYTS